MLGWFANPIFGDGDYPAMMKEMIGNKSLQQGYPESKLTEFSPDELRDVKGMSSQEHD